MDCPPVLVEDEVRCGVELDRRRLAVLEAAQEEVHEECGFAL